MIKEHVEFEQKREVLENARLYTFAWFALTGTKIDEYGRVVDVWGRTAKQIVASMHIDLKLQVKDMNSNDWVKEFGLAPVKLLKVSELHAAVKELCDKQVESINLWDGPHPIDAFLDEFGVVPSSLECRDHDMIAVSDLLEKYNGWAEVQSLIVYPHHRRNVFARELTRLGFIRSRNKWVRRAANRNAYTNGPLQGVFVSVIVKDTCKLRPLFYRDKEIHELYPQLPKK